MARGNGMLKRKTRMALRVALLSLALAPGAAFAQPPEVVQIANPLAQRLETRLKTGRDFGDWTAYRNKRTGKGQYSLAATTAVGPDGTPAMLLISCVESQPAVSVIFDGEGKIMPGLTRIELQLDNHPASGNLAAPLMGRDAVGIFDVRAFLLVQDMTKSRTMEVSLPGQAHSWRFGVEGLVDAIEYMQDQCRLSYQINIVQSELAQVQMQLRLKGYDMPATGLMDDQMKSATRAFQKKFGLPETGRLDQRTYDLMLNVINE
ncbi:peptidoglycan-binding protein [Sinirhodobacter populi]|uniref:Peptidoglycan-binding protein n=2 Tax=Paenirhodobacter populi TaxID=2306993 RepID=A0A443KDX8_9RHOB|nr:peptidoglycan-binding protein [Sinirhodobacter populi]